MALIKLTPTDFTPISEGTHIFKITKAEYNPDFGKLVFTMVTKDGKKHLERFGLLKADGGTNDGAYRALSYFIRIALNNNDIDEVDPEQLVGHYLECDVTHDVVENKNKPGETITFTRLGDKRPCNGWGEETAAPAKTENKTFDLAAILD